MKIATAAFVVVCAVGAAPFAHGLINSFDEIDADGSGDISFVEWSSFFLELHDAPTDEFGKVDASGDGRVTLQEYRQFKVLHARDFHPDSHEPNFGIIDANTDNHLSAAEYSRTVQVYRDSPTNSVERWSVMDADENGSVTREEFVAGVAVNVAEFKKRKAQEARRAEAELGSPQDFVLSTSYSQILHQHRQSEKCPLDATSFTQKIDCAAVDNRFKELLRAIADNGAAGEDITKDLAELRRVGLELLKSVYHAPRPTDGNNNNHEAELDIPLFELLLLLFRRESDSSGSAALCGGLDSARDVALALTGQLDCPSSSTTLDLSTGPSKLSPYSIVSDILVFVSPAPPSLPPSFPPPSLNVCCFDLLLTLEYEVHLLENKCLDAFLREGIRRWICSCCAELWQLGHRQAPSSTTEPSKKESRCFCSQRDRPKQSCRDC